MIPHYKVWIETVIKYRDSRGELHVHLDGNQAFNAYDPDIESPHNTMEDEIQIYGKKTLFSNSIWQCTKLGKDRIQAICIKEYIPINSIELVYKHMNGTLKN